MFGFGKKKPIEITKLSSLIASNVHVIGDVLFSGGLRIDGKVDGNVLGKRGEKSLVVISQHGCVAGRVAAHDAVVNGAVIGDLEVEHFLELQPGAKVSGNISYRQLQMDCGASVDGQLVRVEDQSAKLQAKVQTAVVASKTVKTADEAYESAHKESASVLKGASKFRTSAAAQPHIIEKPTD